jgi:putative two-component system response regulator
LGKVGIADAILLKPGRLTEDEFEIMKTHTTIGAETLESVHKQYPKNEFIKMGIEIAKYHHEKWDGSGYPLGLSGESIPLSARIMALVDVYEALRARRPYKEPFSHDKSKALIIEGIGKHFEPNIVEGFLSIEADFETFYDSMVDE